MQFFKKYFIVIFCYLALMASILIILYSDKKPNNIKQLQTNINKIIKNKDAKIGIAVKFNNEIIFSLNGNENFPLLSVFKLHVALATLNYMSKNNIELNHILNIDKRKIKDNTYSPLREKYGINNIKISLAELIKYTISYSDNNACDILIDYIGGIDQVDKYIRTLGIYNFQILSTEDDMHTDTTKQYSNTSTPIEIVNLLDIFYNKNLFNKKYKDFLIQTMINTNTGSDKIKYLLPKNTIVGHKTGSSDRNKDGIKIADNDSGFIILANGDIYFLSIFISESEETDKENANIISKISKEIYDFIISNH